MCLLLAVHIGVSRAFVSDDLKTMPFAETQTIKQIFSFKLFGKAGHVLSKKFKQKKTGSFIQNRRRLTFRWRGHLDPANKIVAYV